MILLAIILGTLAAGVGSVWVAAALSFGLLARYTQHMLSMAAGALMGTAFLHLLPEAFESAVSPKHLFMALLAGLVFFFLLDKAELWHHGHEHHHGDADDAASHDHGHAHDHDHGHEHAQRQAGDRAHHAGHHAKTHGDHPDSRGADAPAAPAGSWAVLAGDTVHCLGDGILIAAAFTADMRLGLIASVAVLAHEVPHHMGDLAVLRHLSGNRGAAVAKVSLAGASTVLGGLAGYWLLDGLRAYLPYFLVVASSSFVYVALADLIPQLQKRLGARQTLAQIAWLVVGIALVTLVSVLAHRD